MGGLQIQYEKKVVAHFVTRSLYPVELGRITWYKNILIMAKKITILLLLIIPLITSAQTTLNIQLPPSAFVVGSTVEPDS
jgi:uncharacterized membrane-anchored protein